MRIQTEYMSFKNGWMISSSNDFLVHQQRSQRWCCVSQTAHLRSEVLQDLLPVLPVLSLVLPGFLAVLPVVYRLVAGMPRYSQVHLKATASVHSTLGFDHPRILVHQLQDTPWHSQRLPEAPRGSERQKYILLMVQSVFALIHQKIGSQGRQATTSSFARGRLRGATDPKSACGLFGGATDCWWA